MTYTYFWVIDSPFALCRTLFYTLLQMDLKDRYVAANISEVVKVKELEIGKRYPISNAKRHETKYGESILLTIMEFGENPISVF